MVSIFEGKAGYFYVKADRARRRLSADVHFYGAARSPLSGELPPTARLTKGYEKIPEGILSAFEVKATGRSNQILDRF